MNKNPYQILHLEQDATYAQIKQRYRHLTKSLHPDKQPLQNYQISKKLFQQIDQAYKSISSPLRRYLFRQYGLVALSILEEYPAQFAEFDVDQLTSQQIIKLKQLMIYLIYTIQAGVELDRNKFITKTMININNPLNPKRANLMKKNSKRNMYMPQIENLAYEYQMVLPQAYGFSNSLAVSQLTNNIRNNPKYTLGVTFASVKRVLWNHMLSIQSNFTTQESNIDLSVDKILSNHLTVRVTPVSLRNWQLQPPKIALQKSFRQYQISASTDLGSLSIDLNQGSQKRFSKSLKVYVDRDNFNLMPRFQLQLDQHLRIFCTFVMSTQIIQLQKKINIRTNMIYGYKLNINDDLKLQFSSSIGSPNYFQISFYSTKFRASIPLITPDTDPVKFQLLKVTTMVLVYLIIKGVQYKQRRDRKLREKRLKQQQSRLNEQNRELTRQIGYMQAVARQKRESQVKYNGLIVVKAFLGDPWKICKIQDSIKKIIKKQNKNGLNEMISETQEDIAELNLQIGQRLDQVQDITVLIQSQVSGAQLVQMNLQDFLQFNPCLNHQMRPSVLIVYVLRGQLKVINKKCKGSLNLGGISFNPLLAKLKEWSIGMIDYILN